LDGNVPARRGKTDLPHGQLIAPHAGAGTPFFVAAKKGGRSRYHALDEGAVVTRAWDAAFT